MKKIVFDLDGTLTLNKVSVRYEDQPPNAEVVRLLRDYKVRGYTIIIATARNMRSHEGNIGKINATTLPLIIRWLDKNDIPYDEIHVGKPWCGDEGFYVDDKAIRPDEFISLSYTDIQKLLGLGAINS